MNAFGLDGAMFAAEPDPETNFKLFGPVRGRVRTRKPPAAPSRCGCGRTRILPARWKRFAGITASSAPACTAASARPSAPASATAASWCRSRPSLRCAPASIAPGADGTLEAELDVALVDYLGGIAEGQLVRGDNPVLMTMELVLEVLGEEGAG